MPAESSASSISRLLAESRNGDPLAYEQLLPLIYSELHAIARRHMAGERPDHTLQPTALVNEAFLRLVSGQPILFADRMHFIRAASLAMRRVLVDHANARNAYKRSAGLRVTLDEQLASAPGNDLDVLVLDEALTRLAAADARCAQLVELRFFGGMEMQEIADILGISLATAKRDWQFARSWLARELRNADNPPS